MAEPRTPEAATPYDPSMTIDTEGPAKMTESGGHEIDPIARTIGRNVDAERVRLGKTQAEIAEIVGVPQSGMSDRVRGATPIRADELVKLSLALNIPLRKFFEGTGVSFNPLDGS